MLKQQSHYNEKTSLISQQSDNEKKSYDSKWKKKELQQVLEQMKEEIEDLEEEDLQIASELSQVKNQTKEIVTKMETLNDARTYIQKVAPEQIIDLLKLSLTEL